MHAIQAETSTELTQPPQLFVARQPVLDATREVTAYELLFREGPKNAYPVGTDADSASQKVIGHALTVFGLDALLGPYHRAYINVTQRVLTEATYAPLPAGRVVLELLEDLRPDSDTIAACRAARASGYKLALDDFCDQPGLAGFLGEVDIIKVDFQALEDPQRSRVAQRFTNLPVQLLAEKVETEAEFQLACELGFSYFQGFFFCRPEMISRQDIPVSKLIYLQFLSELNRPELDFRRVEALIKQDVALSVKLLKYLKAAAFGWRSEITSIKHALGLLGERAFRRWASILALAVLSGDRPAELLTSCMIRARFCELLAPDLGMRNRELDLFVVGLFSLMDAVVGRPLSELLQDVALPRDLADALGERGEPGVIRDSLNLVKAYERGNWNEVDVYATRIRLPEPEALPAMYQSALAWAVAATRET